MKLFGKKIDKPSTEICVIPRDGKDYVFRAQAVLDFKEFDKLCKEPEMSIRKNVKTGEVSKVPSKDYDKQMDEYATNRMNYLIIKSLEATEGLTWDTIKMEDISTWGNYDKELKESGLSATEVNKIVSAVLIANSLDDTKYKEARERFLASQSKKA